MSGISETRILYGFWKVFLSPVVLLIPLAAMTILAGRGVNVRAIPPHYIAGAVYIYFILSLAYALLSRKNNLKAAFSVSAIANGLLLLILSTVFQAGMAPALAGLFFLSAGITLALTFVTPPLESLYPRKIENIAANGAEVLELEKLMESFPLPCAFIRQDENGVKRITSCNDAFVDLFAPDTPEIAGVAVDTLLRQGSEEGVVRQAGREWTTHKTSKGGQVMLTLSPIKKSKTPAKIEVIDAIDPLTGVYAGHFMKYKARSDFESVARGKRRLSAILFKLSFDNVSEIEVPKPERDLAYTVLARSILDSIRACDSAYRVADDEVLLLLPDTSVGEAGTVIMRIDAKLKQAVPIESPGFLKGYLSHAGRDFVGGVDLPAYDAILDMMRDALYTKNLAELESMAV